MLTKATFPALTLSTAVIVGILGCGSDYEGQAASQTDNLEGPKQEISGDAGCLAKDKPKPKVKIRLGILNGKTMRMPNPTYPTEARRKGISGDVKAEVVIDINTGVIAWAKIQTGDPLLQEAVSRVICQAKFFPANDVNGRASGYLIYKFRPPRKSA